MDINLKGQMNGLQAAEEILPYNIPIIFVTSQTDEATATQIKKLSPHYIFNPYNKNAICEIIVMILNI